MNGLPYYSIVRGWVGLPKGINWGFWQKRVTFCIYWGPK